MRALLQADNVSIQFHTSQSTVQAVRGVSFSLYEGETLAIVGESGCGKSVLCKSILRLLPHSGAISNGKLLFQGQDLTALSEKAMDRIRGREIAMVFQDPMTSLDPTMTIGKQIMEGMRYHYKTPRAEAYKRAVELLEEVGIEDAEKRMKNYPHQLSGGMRQRVVIATALACKPQLLICDEPTTALDVTVQAKILELIQDIQKRTGIAVIYITHDLGVVAKIADFVNVMYAGKIVECGTVDDIFYEPRHPYTWGLLSSMPDLDTADEKLYTIPGSPPNLLHPVKGDAFAPRNEYAMAIDFEEEPPMFTINSHHKAATWLLHPQAPKVEMPAQLRRRIDAMLKGGQ